MLSPSSSSSLFRIWFITACLRCLSRHSASIEYFGIADFLCRSPGFHYNKKPGPVSNLLTLTNSCQPWNFLTLYPSRLNTLRRKADWSIEIRNHFRARWWLSRFSHPSRNRGAVHGKFCRTLISLRRSMSHFCIQFRGHGARIYWEHCGSNSISHDIANH